MSGIHSALYLLSPTKLCLCRCSFCMCLKLYAQLSNSWLIVLCSACITLALPEKKALRGFRPQLQLTVASGSIWILRELWLFCHTWKNCDHSATHESDLISAVPDKVTHLHLLARPSMHSWKLTWCKQHISSEKVLMSANFLMVPFKVCHWEAY